jgi:hypothetical protein
VYEAELLNYGQVNHEGGHATTLVITKERRSHLYLITRILLPLGLLAAKKIHTTAAKWSICLKRPAMIDIYYASVIVANYQSSKRS